MREGVVVEPVDRYLAHLTGIERSPNTVKAYALDLRDFFAFLGSRELDCVRDFGCANRGGWPAA